MLWMVLLASMLVIPSVLAATYTVGDNTGWATPTSGDPYATWASQQTFVVGDVLVFNFVSGSHTVANVTKSSYDGCNTGNPLSIQTTGPASFTIDTVDSHYFICTILNHCSLNQKLSITANANTNTSTGNTPSSSPGSPPSLGSPPSPRAPSPTGQSGANSPDMAMGTLYLMFIGLLVNLIN
ncbi:cucumber peeling cupredoxin-like protein [Tanacetum coccineum]